jgi:hypothetical protein
MSISQLVRTALLMGLHIENKSVKIQTDLPNLSLDIAETLGGIDHFCSPSLLILQRGSVVVIPTDRHVPDHRP